MDLSRLTSPTLTLEIGGQNWTFSALSIRDNEELVLEMKREWPDPLAAARDLLSLPGLSQPERIAVLEQTFNARLKPRMATSYEFDLWKRAGANVAIRLWFRRLRKVHSAITEEEAFRLHQAASQEQREQVETVDELPLGNSSAPAGPGPTQAVAAAA